jgi:uncharacterized protein YwlG (UPF0340 family)
MKTFKVEMLPCAMKTFKVEVLHQKCQKKGVFLETSTCRSINFYLMIKFETKMKRRVEMGQYQKSYKPKIQNFLYQI